MVLADLDDASLNINKNGLNSQYPAEIYDCLNLLEEVDHPDLSDLIGQLLSNELRLVRMDALQRVQRLMLTDLADQVVARMTIEADADDRYIYVNHLIEEAHVITWLLAAMADLYGRAHYDLIHSALGNELDLRRDKMHGPISPCCNDLRPAPDF